MRSQMPMAAIRVPTTRPDSTRSGLVASILSRTRPATVPPMIGITMIRVTSPRILTSPIGVNCAIRFDSQRPDAASIPELRGSGARDEGGGQAGHREAVDDGRHALADPLLGSFVAACRDPVHDQRTDLAHLR